MSHEPNPALEAALGGIKTRVIERHEAINQAHVQNEESADQQIVADFRNAASACPPEHPGPKAKENFESIATQYERCPTRDDRDRLLYEVAPSGSQTPWAMGESISGNSIDSDPSDGMHKVIYDTDDNGIPDHEAWADDDTNEQIGESKEVGALDSIMDIISSIFS
ncbi:hypothetical protein RHS01_01398 [Rhizoctonia solani]|uniref:Uncharacterized protein n=1 Tax=Rhizoctonia solani TaxID=456999 RepID=A0A8H7M8A9_9AGAM|nr:hypothetical protein RHS01_01398 [Rhizoctonia solani]